MPKFVLLWTDAAIWLLVAALLAYTVMVVRRPGLSANWRKVFADPAALASSVILLLCLGVTLLDSVHFRPLLPPAPGSEAAGPAYDTRTRSVLDVLLAPLVESREATYSRPLSYLGFTKESVEVDGEIRRVAPRLVLGGAHLDDPESQWLGDMALRGALGLMLGAWWRGCCRCCCWPRRASRGRPAACRHGRGRRGEGLVPWRAACWTVLAVGLLAGPAAMWAGHYHLLGTDLTGNDVLYQALKSIRTAFVIGTLATVATLPLAVGLGILAGYFRAGSTRSSSTSTPCCRRCPTCC